MKKIILAVLVAIGIEAQSQQLALFTEYMYNEVTLNPAYAGSHDVISATVLGRTQWVGSDFKGAPETFSMNVHAPLANKKIGVGLSLLQDQSGAQRNFNAMASASYIIPFANSDLHFGLQVGAANHVTDVSNLNVHDYDDSYIPTSGSGVLPNFGLGVYYFAKQFYIGASAPQLLNNQIKVGGQEIASQVRHYFFNTGYVMDLTPSVKLKPTLFFKYVSNVDPQLDLTASFIIRDVFWVGAAWRTAWASKDSYDLLLGIQATDQFKVGYSYDLTSNANALSQFNKGTHELVLNYRFSFDKKKIVTPRYF